MIRDWWLEYKKKTWSQQQKANNPIWIWRKDLNRCFSREDIQIVNKHMKRCSTLLVIGKIKSKPYFIECVNLKWPPSLGKNVEILEASCIANGIIKWYNHFGKNNLAVSQNAKQFYS